MSTVTASTLTITITQNLIDRANPDSDSQCAAALAILAVIDGAKAAVISFVEAGGMFGLLARVDCGERGVRVFSFDDAGLMDLIRLEAGAVSLPVTLTLSEVSA